MSDALSIVRQTLSPDIVKQKGSVELKIGRSNPTKTNSQNASKSSKTDQKLPLVGDTLLPSKAPAPIPKKESTQPRHNDSYIMATQFGIKKIPIDPKINRSQSLKALQYINGQSTEDSVIYKGNVLRIAQPVWFDPSLRRLFSQEATGPLTENNRPVSKIAAFESGRHFGDLNVEPR